MSASQASTSSAPPVPATASLAVLSHPRDRLELLDQKAGITGRTYVQKRDLRTIKTHKGLPVDIRRAADPRLDVIGWLVEKTGWSHDVAVDRFKRMDGLRIAATDRGSVFDHAIVLVEQDPEGELVYEQLLSSPHGRQEFVRATARSSSRYLANLAPERSVTSSADRAMLAATDPRMSEQLYRNGQQSASHLQRQVHQFLDLAGLMGHHARPTQPGLVTPGRHAKKTAMPLIFVIGDGAGGTGKVRGRRTANYGNAFIRELRKEAIGRRLDVLFVTEDEYLTTAACQDRTCREARDDRVDMKYPRRLVSHDECQRILQCSVCGLIVHRDLSAALKIFYAFWHRIAFGTHPFRPVKATAETPANI